MDQQIITEKEREPFKSFLHIITWNEFYPYIPRLEQSQFNKEEKISYKNLLDEAEIRKANNQFFDASFTELAYISYKDEEILRIIKDILVSRNFTLIRGDTIRLQFIEYRCYGTFFYDGKNVIFPEKENSDYFGVPSTFLIPTEFPIDYWNDCNFIGFSQYGDFCFDTKRIQSNWESINWQEYKNGIVLSSTIFLDDNTDISIAIVNNTITDKTTKEDKQKMLEKTIRDFVNTGRCFYWDKLEEIFWVGVSEIPKNKNLSICIFYY
jgi:hypothetical protein